MKTKTFLGVVIYHLICHGDTFSLYIPKFKDGCWLWYTPAGHGTHNGLPFAYPMTNCQQLDHMRGQILKKIVNH